MTEGVGLAVLYAFGPLGLHRVEADVQPGNEPSRRLVQRPDFAAKASPPSSSTSAASGATTNAGPSRPA
ncbi:GNAT family N-acetyltransferase [Actinomadura madurae]|nr:GNAT family protein [Actinomadura madurae]MCP9969503.1 GNAT family N-acetyltransferase [Actinomadura madurae]